MLSFLLAALGVVNARNIELNWTRDGVEPYQHDSNPLRTALGDVLTLRCGQNVSNLFIQTEKIQYDSCNASSGSGIYDYNGFCIKNGELMLTLTENSQSLMNTVNFMENSIYYLASYSNDNLRDADDKSIHSGGQCENGVKMILVIGNVNIIPTTIPTTLPGSTSSNCLLPAVGPNMHVEWNFSNVSQIIYYCQPLFEPANVIMVASCTQNGTWNPDPQTLDCSLTVTKANVVPRSTRPEIVATVVTFIVVVVIVFVIIITAVTTKVSIDHCRKRSYDTNTIQDVYVSNNQLLEADHHDQPEGVYSTLQRDEQVKSSKLIYADVNGNSSTSCVQLGPTISLQFDDNQIQYVEVNQQSESSATTKASLTADGDDLLNLDTLLIQLRSEVTPKWYQFGLAVGIPKDTLNKYSGYPPEECIVEVLDFWLRNQPRAKTPSWRDVSKALEKIELHDLADSIMNVYQTGRLPLQLDMDTIPEHLLSCHTQLRFSVLPPPLPPKLFNEEKKSASHIQYTDHIKVEAPPHLPPRAPIL